MLQLDPRVKKSRMLIVLPKFITPYTDIDEPKRMNDLQLIVLPMLIMSRTLRLEPRRAIP
jgi:hypothetical protein